MNNIVLNKIYNKILTSDPITKEELISYGLDDTLINELINQNVEFVDDEESEETTEEASSQETEEESQQDEEEYFCPECGAKITLDMTQCPNCGVEFEFEEDEE